MVKKYVLIVGVGGLGTAMVREALERGMTADDGSMPNVEQLRHLGAWVDEAYRTHGACIEAIRAAGINYVIFCPGRMASGGRRIADVRSTVRIDRDAGPVVSYDDAAWVMLEGALTDVYDRQLVSAATSTQEV